MAAISTWSTTAANNNSASPDGWPENMAPSGVNNSARENMAATRVWYEDCEWVDWGDTPTQTAVNAFTISGDVTARYSEERRIKMYGTTLGTIYGRIVSSSFSSPDTTVTVLVDDGTELTSNLSQVYLAAVSANNTSFPVVMSDVNNLIPAGDFSVNPWQRGTSFTSIANGAYCADRFQYAKSGAMVHDISKSADAPTLAQANYYTDDSLLIDCTTADASIAAGDFSQIQMSVEGYDWKHLYQRTFTLSFWVKGTKTGTHCVSFRNSGTDRSYIAEYTINTTDTWEFKSITVAAQPSGGTWNLTNGMGITVIWALATGSTYQTTAGAWQSGNYFATSNQVNACDSASNNFRLALVQLTATPVPVPFRTLDYANLLNYCYRYYERLNYDQSSYQVICNGMNISTTAAEGKLFYRTKRINNSSISFTAANTFAIQPYQSGALQLCTTVTTDGIGYEGVNLQFTGITGGMSAGNGCQLCRDVTDTTYIEIDAEL